MTPRYRTTCPHCASTFRLGSDQLEAAAGWVQCGVCGAAFNAREALVEETPATEPASASPAPMITTSPPPPAPAAPSSTPPAAPPSESAVASPNELPSIILIDPDAVAAEEPEPLPEIPKPAPFVPVPPPPPTAVPASPIAYEEIEAPPPAPPPRRRPWLATVVSLILLVTLAAQTAFFLRDALVSRYPQTRPLLEQACATLGCTLSLPKELAQLRIVGSDLQTEGPGQLRLNLTLGNRATRAQAWPMLVLTLTDQRNQPLARRSFAPSEYLADARRIAAGIPPRSEQPLSLALTVRDLAPMGFNLQLSY